MEYGEYQTDYQTTLQHYTGHAKPLCPSFRNIVLSGGPGSFLNIRQVHQDYFDIDTYQSVCKTHDEMWNWLHSARLNFKHVGLHSAFIVPGVVEEYQSTGLRALHNSNQHVRDIFDKFITIYPDIVNKLVVDY